MIKNQKTPLIINCDTGIDDAVALIMAIKSSKFDIKLITTDLGNITPLKSAQNCLNIMELINAPSIPVAAGDGKCLVYERPRYVAHGKSGLGDFIFKKNDRKICKENAVEMLHTTLSKLENPITILCMSPISNIAKLILKYPDDCTKIKNIVYMAGSIEQYEKYEIPYAEFNISCDPESAEIVFNSSIPIEIIPMELGHDAYFDWKDVYKIKNTNYTGSVLEFIFRSYKDRHVSNGIANHDGTAIAYLINPTLFETKNANASIKYYSQINTGILNIELKKPLNVKVCTNINIEGYKKLFFKCLKKCR